jgi:carboxymethylenebutenolidase
MCDDHTEADNERLFKAGKLTRRRLGALAGAAGMALVLPRPAHAVDVTEADVTVETPDGTADCYFVHPSAGPAAAVLVWPDIFGLRPAFRAMGKRLAESGYAVLVVNPFYRQAVAPVVNEGDTLQTEGVRDKLFGLMGALTPETQMTDARAFVGWLDAQAAVDTTRKVGTQGYCMGGPLVMRTAAAVPDRIGAVASFHGGGLTTDQPDSPHLLIPEMKASFLIAIAQNDDAQQPTSKDILRESFDAAGLMAEIEVYPAQHGWCPPDSQVYDEAQAERAWERLLALYGSALA